jgi:protein ImuA
VHELLSDPKSPAPKTIALLLARAAQKGKEANGGGAVVWSDPAGELYPPALLSTLPSISIDLRRLILLRCADPAHEMWALAECLACKGVSATIACISRLNQLQARRLQLAAERGGGIGLFMRPYSSKPQPYAAATRWRVSPVSGTEQTQRWSLELLHGHGGPRQAEHGGQVVLIEVNRETRAVRASAPIADRQAPQKTARASA